MIEKIYSVSVCVCVRVRNNKWLVIKWITKKIMLNLKNEWDISTLFTLRTPLLYYIHFILGGVLICYVAVFLFIPSSFLWSISVSYACMYNCVLGECSASICVCSTYVYIFALFSHYCHSTAAVAAAPLIHRSIFFCSTSIYIQCSHPFIYATYTHTQMQAKNK